MFYLRSPEMWSLGYQRSIVVQFSKGMTSDETGAPGTILKVEQHFHDNQGDVDEFIKEYQGSYSIELGRQN